MVNKLPGSATVLHVPQSHWHCQLSNYDWTGRTNTATEVLRFTERAAAGVTPHLFMHGPPGLGKSHISVGLYRWGVYTWGTADCMWLDVSEFCDMVKRGYDGQHADPFELLAEARRLVVFDDLLGRDMTDHEINVLFPRMLRTVHANAAAFVLTSNYDRNGLAERFNAHEMSRLFDNAKTIRFRGNDERLPWRE